METSLVSGANASEASTQQSGIYTKPLPDFIWPAIEALYQSIFCSEPHLRINNTIDIDTCAWVGRKDGVINAVLLFTCRAGIAKVINEVIALSPNNLAEFSTAVFNHYPHVTAISFHAIKLDSLDLPAFSHCTKVSEDFVLPLPESEKKWLESLSKQTREKIRYHTRRSQRKQPDLYFRYASGSQISDADLSAVIEMNRARMKIKNKEFGMNKVEENNLKALLRERGLVTMMHANDKLCAGLLSTVCGKDIYMHVIAHDPAYDDLRLGFLCCSQTIQLAITQGMQRFHFLWGEYDYKTRLGGQRELLIDVVVYKSGWHTFIHPLLVSRIWLGLIRQSYRNWRKKNQGVKHVR